LKLYVSKGYNCKYIFNNLSKLLIDLHPDISNYAPGQMAVYPGSDFSLINDNPIDNTSSSQSVTVTNNPTLSENTITTKSPIGTPYSSDLSIQGRDKTFSNLTESTKYSQSINLTCSISGSASISYALQANGANALPGWVILDSPNKLLNFTTPEVSSDTNYTFNIVATESGTDYMQTIYLEVIHEEEEVEEYEMPESIQKTQTTTQAAASAGVGFAALSSLFSGSSPQAMWVMMNQIQLILLLPVLLKNMPDEVSHFIFGMDKLTPPPVLCTYFVLTLFFKNLCTYFKMVF
jgi:hypothetical protein